jgi:uncharacterized protein YndB with AHSA1/START domain
LPDIVYEFPIRATRAAVFRALTTAQGLDAWWSKTSSGVPEVGNEYHLGFGPEYAWRAVVTHAVPNQGFELLMTTADADWTGSRVRFDLADEGASTRLVFHHRGWPSDNEHYRVSCFCWALYLRVLRRYVERGELVAYEDRLDA